MYSPRKKRTSHTDEDKDGDNNDDDNQVWLDPEQFLEFLANKFPMQLFSVTEVYKILKSMIKKAPSLSIIDESIEKLVEMGKVEKVKISENQEEASKEVNFNKKRKYFEIEVNDDNDDDDDNDGNSGRRDDDDFFEFYNYDYTYKYRIIPDIQIDKENSISLTFPKIKKEIRNKSCSITDLSTILGIHHQKIRIIIDVLFSLGIIIINKDTRNLIWDDAQEIRIRNLKTTYPKAIEKYEKMKKT